MTIRVNIIPADVLYAKVTVQSDRTSMKIQKKKNRKKTTLESTTM